MKILEVVADGKVRCYHPQCAKTPANVGQFKIIKKGVKCYAFRMPDDIGKYTDYFYCAPCAYDLYLYMKEMFSTTMQIFK